MKADEMILSPERQKLTAASQPEVEPADERSYFEKKIQFSAQFEGARQGRLASIANRKTKIANRDISKKTPRKSINKVMKHDFQSKKHKF